MTEVSHDTGPQPGSNNPQTPNSPQAPIDFNNLSTEDIIRLRQFLDQQTAAQTESASIIVKTPDENNNPTILGDDTPSHPDASPDDVRTPAEATDGSAFMTVGEKQIHSDSLLGDPGSQRKRSLSNRAIAWIAGGAAATLALVSWGVASASRSDSGPIATASAPARPNPAPSASETAPDTPQLPFDTERVALMKKESADEFYENNGRMLRIQYVLSELYDQVNVRSDYGQMLDQELPNGKTLSDYNPFKEISLTAEADPQDVMDSYIFGWIYAVAHKDPDEGLKMLSTVVRDPKSPFFKDLRTLVEENAGTKVDESIVKKSYYKALSSKRYEKDGETHLSIITEGGFKYEFAFTPVEGLAAVNENTEDNDKEVGVWQGLSSKMGKVTINF